MSLIKYLIYSLFFFVALQCNKEQEKLVCKPVSANIERINGVNWVAVSNQIPASDFDELSRISAGWVSLIPYGFIENGSSTVQYNSQWQWYGEKVDGIREHCQFAKAKGLKVMIKPHVWLGWGEYTGDYGPDTEEGWLEFESTFMTYILEFADVAQNESVEMLCIGTEWKNFVVERPDYWSRLIDSVEVHFDGKITYAGNWDAYKLFPHWSKLDYIGIDAYFPVSSEETPQVSHCKEGWLSHIEEMKALSIMHNKKVIFTEYGYRSMDFAGKEPWVTGNGTGLNFEAQNNAYKALFETFYAKDWYNGGFLWKWFPDYQNAGGIENNRFTPQNKPVEQIINSYYKEE